MKKLIIIVIVLFGLTSPDTAQQHINLKQYVENFLRTNYRSHILNPIIWPNSDTNNISNRYYLIPLDSSSINDRGLCIYHLRTAVSEVGLDFIVLKETYKKDEKIKIVGMEEKDNQKLTEDLIYLNNRYEYFKFKETTLIDCYDFLLIQYRNERVQGGFKKPVVHDTIK